MNDTGTHSVAVEAGRLTSGTLVAERAGNGVVTALYLDAAGSVLTEIVWTPGQFLTLRTLQLAQPVPLWSSAASHHGEYLALGVPGENLHVVHRTTGAVETYRPVEQPACLTPDGKGLVSCTDRGLLVQVVQPKPAAMPRIGFIRPLLVTELDTPDSMLLIPGEHEQQFDLVIGGYGQLSRVRVQMPSGTAASAQAQDLSTGGLPYDPILLQRPAPLRTGPGCHVYAVDHGYSGLVAVDLATDTTHKCPLGPNAYGLVRRVVPRLDGTDCIVETAAGAHVWTPGTDPHPLAGVSDTVMLWHGEWMLVLDADRLLVREQALN